MKAYDASVEIQASPDTIWGILTDAPGYQAWDSGVEGSRAASPRARRSPCARAPTPAAPSRSR